MKTQISRDSHNQGRRYSGVYQQQGRMLTDADWNESVDLLRLTLHEALQDVIGSGSPRVGAVRINGDLTIQPGDLYVDGLRAELPGSGPLQASAQPDFPGSPDLPATGACVVYADVWERTVTALEDAGLRDAGLHGADTCTRTQTMLQIKTCPPAKNFEPDIPTQGNARLTLTLHANLEPSDICDPCAGLIATQAGRVGNYLFRLEVHQVEGPAQTPTRLVLKWSSENGAEHYAALSSDQLPPGFINSRYLYEFFNPITEKHPGVHLAPGFSPVAGVLKTVYEIPEGDGEPKDFVRRWDGYCELTRAGSVWSLVTGWDRGVALSTAVADTAPGYVSLGPNLTVNLDAIQLDLQLKNNTFVTGDFWLAPVREAIHGPGSEIINGASPTGITHHYLQLARLFNGNLEDEADAVIRQHHFPTLTDLQAQDVGYQTDCASDLFDPKHDNVKKALDRLCQLAAQHVRYSTKCDSGLFDFQHNTVKKALDRLCQLAAQHVRYTTDCDSGLFDTSHDTVQKALNRLCQLAAQHVHYQPGPGCTFLAQPDISTVQGALDALCQRPNGRGKGCRVTVGQEGEFPTLEQALKTLREEAKIYDICLCLLTGEHEFGGTLSPLPGQDHFHLSITGCGSKTTIVLKGALTFSQLNSLCLENFVLEGSWENDFPLIVENCTELVLRELHHFGLAREKPLLQISGGNRVRLEKNILEAYTLMGLKNPRKVFEFYPSLSELFTLPQRDQFLEAAPRLAGDLVTLSPRERLSIINRLIRNLESLVNDLAKEEFLSYVHFYQALRGDTPVAEKVFAGLWEVRDQAHHAEAATAIVFHDAMAQVSLADNTVFGGVSLYGFPKDDLTIDEMIKLQEISSKMYLQGQGAMLQAWGNRFSRLAVGDAMIQQLRALIQDTSGTLPEIYRSVLLDNNLVATFRNQLLGENLTLAANNFETLQNPVGWAVGQTAIFTGNRVRRTRDASRQEVGGGQMMSAAPEIAKAANLPANSW